MPIPDSEKILSYIPWMDSPRFSKDMILGTSGKYYNIFVDYHVRTKNWYISLSTTDEQTPIISGQKLILSYDLLSLCYHELKPDCILFAATEDENVDDIGYNEMVTGTVKLLIINSDTLRKILNP